MWARQLGEDIASYFNKNLIRNEHSRRQGSEERILHHITIGIQYEANTGEYEAGQPREDSASYLDMSSIRNEHWRTQGSEERISHHT